MASWDQFLTERDRAVFAKAGYGKRQGLGSRPALLVIDVTYAFAGDRPEPILKAIERYRNSCGDEAWAAIRELQTLLRAARAASVPVAYTCGLHRRGLDDAGRWASKNTRAEEDFTAEQARGNEIVSEIAPQASDLVIPKAKPSAFFGTPLLSYLIQWGVDTLLVTGSTTSGCVRATVVDAFSYNYRIGVVAEACFDRGQASHGISLFDMNAKYADVVDVPAVLRYLERLRDARQVRSGSTEATRVL